MCGICDFIGTIKNKELLIKMRHFSGREDLGTTIWALINFAL